MPPQPPPQQYDFSGLQPVPSHGQGQGQGLDQYDFSGLGGDDTDILVRNAQDIGRAGLGAIRGVVSTAQTLASPIRSALGMAPATPPPEETTTAGKIGRGVEQMGEFYLPAGWAEDILGLMRVAPRLRAVGYSRAVAKYGQAAVDAILQATGAGGVSALHGESPTLPAAISGGVPFISPVASHAVPWLARSAHRAVTGVLEQGVPARVAETTAGYNRLTQAARTALRLRIPSTWRGWADQASEARSAVGQHLQWILDSPLGQQPLPTAEWQSIMDDAITDASRLVPLDANGQQLSGPALVTALSTGAAPGGWQQVAKDKLYVRALLRLKDELSQTHVSAQDLHDLKQIWQNMVFGPGDRGTRRTMEEMLASARSAAANVAATGLQRVFAKESPSIADADLVFSRIANLHDHVTNAMLKAQGSGKGFAEMMVPATTKQAVGAGIGSIIGGAAGYAHGPSIVGSLTGAVMGGAAARMLEIAMASPAWKLTTAQWKYNLATHIASGNLDRVRRLLTPVIAGTVSQRPSQTIQDLLSGQPAGAYTLNDGSKWIRTEDGRVLSAAAGPAR